ncbi:MAG: nucleoside-diphosphate kinase [Candidatus Wallbacteria bacterium HGW-Wallbacteria-1]|uniref:Nucleoside diphosphate kinase n=1 Tax=Candidatus Wallbacteria bacterium HGW-Wallbacteria-1 TaxID=2013854 RepID=A0A2N1PTA6_9BACT|nr:MAG: nucleoside-diphosphate kinase [Candidatus Wallbacteria bacterium HGW-Wallbacteria-1]
MELQRTFVMVKPDGVKRGLIGEIIKRFGVKGLKIVAMKMLLPDRELASQHYRIHEGKPFFNYIVDYITSGPVVAMVLQGHHAVGQARQVIGATDPEKAATGTIRGDMALTMDKNLVHGSDAQETARQEIALWFPEGVIDYELPIEDWI